MSLLSTAIDVFFGTKGSGSIAGLRLDAVMSESLSLNSEISQYARENGAPFTDGIIPNIKKLSIDGIVTTANIVLLDGLLSTGSFAPTGESKLVAARKALEKVYLDRQPVSIVTSGITYTNMGMATCELRRRGDGNDGELSISATFYEMPTVTVQTTVVNVSQATSVAKVAAKAGATKATVGQVSGVASVAPAATPSPSAALSMLKMLKGL